MNDIGVDFSRKDCGYCGEYVCVTEESSQTRKNKFIIRGAAASDRGSCEVHCVLFFLGRGRRWPRAH